MAMNSKKAYDITCKAVYKKLKANHKIIDGFIKKAAKKGDLNVSINFTSSFMKEHKKFFIEVLKTNGYIVKCEPEDEDSIIISWGE